LAKAFRYGLNGREGFKLVPGDGRVAIDKSLNARCDRLESEERMLFDGADHGAENSPARAMTIIETQS